MNEATTKAIETCEQILTMEMFDVQVLTPKAQDALRHLIELVKNCPLCGKMEAVEKGATNTDSDLTNSIKRGDENG